MFRMSMLVFGAVLWLIGVSNSFGQCTQQSYAVAPSLDVSSLCNAAIGQTTTTTTSYTTAASYVASPSAVPTPVYSYPTYNLPIASFPVYRQSAYYPASSFPVRTYVPAAGFNFQRALSTFPTYNVGRRSSITVLNGIGGGVHSHPGRSDVTIVNNLPPQRAGGGGFIRGVGGAVSDVIGAIGQVANSPAGLVAIGAGIGGAGPLGFLGGPRGGGNNGLNAALNFQAAQNRGLNPNAAAAFAASQRGRRGR